MSINNISYQYKNNSEEPVSLWLSVAPGTRSIVFNHAATNQSKHSFLGDIYYFEIPSQQIFTYKAQYEYKAKKSITEEERRYFLRNCILIPVNNDIQEKADEITKGFSVDLDKAKAIFNYIRRNFKYSSKIKQRGFDSCTQTKIGDCGELSAVLASYCRAIGIPCRVMVGAFTGTSQLHAWNEVYIENKGWIPVDVSLAMYTFFRYPLSNIGATVKWGAFRKKTQYFGEIEKGRVVFSIDPEIELMPEYNDSINPTNDMKFPVGSKYLSWGYESLHGKAPYMQPIYPKLNNTFKKITNKDVLGVCQVRANNALDYYSHLIKLNSFWIAAIFIYCSMFINLFNITVPNFVDLFISGGTSLFLGLFGILTLIRREYNIPILILSLLFTFSILGFFVSLI